VTSISGDIEFWADGPNELDVAIADTQAPSRITARTMGWNPQPAAPGSISTTMLAKDGALAIGSLGADVLRQTIQIGQIIEWWRPADTVPIPSGFELCDGHQVLAGQHEFPGVANINVPNLINTFTLGADPTKAQGTPANLGNSATDGPGIGGAGGSNGAKDFSHGHAVPGVDHVHYATTPDHLHLVGSLYTGSHAHGASSGTESAGVSTVQQLAGGPLVLSRGNHTHGVTVAASGNVGIGGSTGAADRSLAHWTTGVYKTAGGATGAAQLNTATNSTTWTADPGGDVRPRFVGLLKIIKVRRS